MFKIWGHAQWFYSHIRKAVSKSFLFAAESVFLRLPDLVLSIFAYKKYGKKIVNDLNVYQRYRPILSSAYSQADTY